MRDLMTAEPVAVPAHIPVADAIRDYFLRYGYGGFPGVRSGQVMGLLELAQVKAVPREEGRAS